MKVIKSEFFEYSFHFTFDFMTINIEKSMMFNQTPTELKTNIEIIVIFLNLKTTINKLSEILLKNNKLTLKPVKFFINFGTNCCTRKLTDSNKMDTCR